MDNGALVLGGGYCVWHDVVCLEAQLGRQWDGVVVAANDIGVWWPRRLDHWATLHPERLLAKHGWVDPNGGTGGWLAQRVSRGLNRPKTWGHDKLRDWPVDEHIEQWGVGSSGLLAVAVAHLVTSGPVILCGVPMTDSPHFAESEMHGGAWTQFRIHRKAWEANVDRLRERTRSMSGWTRELLGAP